MTTPSPEPAEPTPPAQTSGPACNACGGDAVVNWRRRPTPGELSEHVTAEQARREQILLLADPQQPAPVFPPLPTSDDTTRTIYACANHAISRDDAARIHQARCSAPFPGTTGGTEPVKCDCTPEPLPAPTPGPVEEDEQAAGRLPAHWVTGDA